MGRIQVHSITQFDKVGYVTLNERGNEADGIVLYRMMDNDHCGIYYVEAENGYEQEQDQMIKTAFDDITSAKKIPVPTCKEAKAWYEREKMLREQQEDDDIRMAIR